MKEAGRLFVHTEPLSMAKAVKYFTMTQHGKLPWKVVRLIESLTPLKGQYTRVQTYTGSLHFEFILVTYYFQSEAPNDTE